MKKSIFILTALLFIGFISTTFAQELRTGEFSAKSNRAGYTLHKNDGDRTYTMEVTFDNPFEKRPEIILSVSQIEIADGANVRYNVQSSAVSRDGFTIRISTWGNTKVLSIAGKWIAITQ
ncbi:MAG: hypothetical protein HND52_03125 [Ignavibacteriae bacterium]|nr:hypothetical protein [Ignavibacteriota bacterium]NOG96945.1 hypothetical protein [Ignavibacteriota bacterium]